MAESIVSFLIHLPGLAWWREVYDMPFEVWEQCCRIVELKQRG